MEDSQIIKTLRCSGSGRASREDCEDCDGCPGYAVDHPKCMLVTLDAAADLIERLQKELEAAIKLVPHSCATCLNRDCLNGKPPYACKVGGCEDVRVWERWKYRGIEPAK